MDTLKTRCLLLALLAILSACVAAGPPAPPSPPECFRECDETECSGEIKCIWDPIPDSKIPTNYRLHWETANSEDEYWTGNSSDGVIHRHNIPSHIELCVWVQAWNQHGSVNSQEVFFNTEDIIKPPPPTILSSCQDPLEINWSTKCDHLGLSLETCDVRYRTEEHRDWLEYDDGLFATYGVSNPQPATVYQFQVRCACHISLKSDWSEIYGIKSAESAPIGEVDVWRDCSVSPSSIDCFLTWKDLSISQARGLILGHEVKISYNNSSVTLVNESVDETSSLLVHDGLIWRLTTSLKDVSSVSVLAYNALGATSASYLVVPAPGKEAHDQIIHLEMNEENLTVSWDPATQFSDDLKQYVVQYKACPPGQGFDWIKVDKSQTTAFFKGPFKKHTQYRVSLFAVLSTDKVHQLSTAIGYSVQGVPSRVLSFKVLSYGATDATLFWEPVPCSQQNGTILYYQIGEGMQKVYNVSVTPQHENNTFKLSELNPGQDYEVWIRAVTAVGPGAKVTMRFKTVQHKRFENIVPVLIVIPFLVFICLLLVLFRVCQGEKASPFVPQCLYGKVPDPSNSRIFKQMKHQINEPLAWICIPLAEPFPKISLLEFVETNSTTFYPDGLTRLVTEDGFSEDHQNDQGEDVVTDECDRTDHRYQREEYSKMVDSDEERDDCCSSSEEEQLTSGYEKHFMPTAFEILEDS
ncbi:interleukin 12 receptor, beta 2a, like [Melanotaenia boesemani]|uniref:interleukin 12 receptor, beta 2a, like n=1 Tax=Melanotaenia boesemani TaxID=1250792 RepID=UPI001C053EB1|nr:interleukin 12 receptor, beta 2a, like [Melanotaenia boesemani]